VPNYRVVVLASGTGSLFQALIDNSANLGIDIVCLISDSEVQACDRARSAQIPVQVIPMKSDGNIWNKELAAQLRAANPDLIISAGFMKVLGAELVSEFEGKIINTHPALLPSFPGAHAVRDVLAAGVSETGSTIHFVDAGIDTGAVIAQEKVSVLTGDSESELHERIKVVERELLIEVVKQIVQGKVRYENGKVVTA
jgi:phosphoribosylglycinamide formyltransferase-1